MTPKEIENRRMARKIIDFCENPEFTYQEKVDFILSIMI